MKERDSRIAISRTTINHPRQASIMLNDRFHRHCHHASGPLMNKLLEALRISLQEGTKVQIDINPASCPDAHSDPSIYPSCLLL